MPLSSQKDRVLRAVVKEIEGQQSDTDYLSLVSTSPCFICANLTECMYMPCTMAVHEATRICSIRRDSCAAWCRDN